MESHCSSHYWGGVVFQLGALGITAQVSFFLSSAPHQLVSAPLRTPPSYLQNDDSKQTNHNPHLQ